MAIGAVVAALSVVGFLVWFFSRSGRPTTESFLVSNRSIPFLLGVATVAATWTQAFALVVGATFAYQSGWHFLWFIVPNMLALIVAGIMAPRIQAAVPRGYTLAQVVGQAFGPKVRTVFFLSAFASLIYIVASAMTALQQWISQQLQIPTWQISIGLGAFAFLWVIRRGLPAAVIGDVVKVILIIAGIVGAIALHISYADTVPLFTLPATSVSPGNIFWLVGVPLIVTFLAGVLCNPDIAERSYAVNHRVVRRAYFVAAAFFAIIVMAYGSLGFLAKNLGLGLSNTQPPALAVLQATVPEWVVLLVTIALVVIIAAAIASLLASAGDLMVIEIYRRFINRQANDREIVKWSRVFMAGTVILATSIAALNLDLTLLIQSVSVVRGEVVIPMLLALFWPKIASQGTIFWGMIAGLVIGVGLMFGANFWQYIFGDTSSFLVANGRPLGALTAFLSPLVAVFLVWLFRPLIARPSVKRNLDYSQ